MCNAMSTATSRNYAIRHKILVEKNHPPHCSTPSGSDVWDCNCFSTNMRTLMGSMPLSIFGGHDGVKIKGGLLQVGVYLVSRICKGKVVDTKRMVLTK